MEQYILQSASFKKLKGLQEANFTFGEYLTAIMGVNGSGKTTVIHALACAYQPPENGNGENHKFPDFFIPNTDSLWTGSAFSIENKKENGTTISRHYTKESDRWKPRYNDRPKRNIYYIGIDTCLPEIEKTTTQSRIQYTSSQRNDRDSIKIIAHAAYILNKKYATLINNEFRNKHFTGVKLESQLQYSSLSMGTGELRTIKIFETVIKAEPYSLTLIDEIDLLLHVSSLKKLIKKLSVLAKNKYLQIIFTTHSLEMLQLTQYVKIQYIDTIHSSIDGNDSEKTVVYSGINSDLIYNLTGKASNILKIYVEDELAKSIVKRTLKSLNCSRYAEVIKYGSVENAFTLASAKVISNENIENTLIILDGDKYCESGDKERQINKKLSGTESNIDEKRRQALSLIRQFNLPQGKTPEKFFYDLLIENGDKDSELFMVAEEINVVGDEHEWLYNIRDRLNYSEENLVRDIIDIASNSPSWNDYIMPIKEWIESKVCQHIALMNI